jgi:hypothetical protein
VELIGAKLVSSIISDNQATTTLLSNIETAHLGRGYFEFVPFPNTSYFFVTTDPSSGNTLNRYNLNVINEPEASQWEINFSVTKKVIQAPDEELEVRIFTNRNMKTSDVYVLGVFNKE